MSYEMNILIGDIPKEYHTPDLRNFFSYSIEKEFFILFNYRQRPNKDNKSNIAILKLKSNKYDEFLKLYNDKSWVNRLEQVHKTLKCKIFKIKKENKNIDSALNLNNKNNNNDILEFRNIPEWMPQGNVGTPTKLFIEYINQCKMPQSLISRLGINITHYRKNKNKLYTNVQYKYENEQLKQQENDQDNDDDDDELEDWERHESLHDDVHKQDRTSPYLFEHEIELKWEKGGSGLVFYTDENYWKDLENKDFDEETADDWDLDMRVYYEPDEGDTDAIDLLDMRKSDLLRNGVDISQEIDKLNSNKKLNPFHVNKIKKKKIGNFEQFTKGFGRKHLEKLGWKDGESIGKANRSGLKEALDASDGKNPMDKTGFGYHGKKVNKSELIKDSKQRQTSINSDSIFIGCKYDQDLTKSDCLLTRDEFKMKYRNNT